MVTVTSSGAGIGGPRTRPSPSLFNRTTGRMVAPRAALRRDLLGLLFGLMGRRLDNDFALGLRPCSQIHTFFVRGPIDVLFCDNDGRVLEIVAALPPDRISLGVRGAKIVWESAAGTLAPNATVGDIVTLALPGK